MPEFLVSDGGDLPKYARFDANGKKMAFVEMESATGFPTAEAAAAARDAAMAAMVESGKKRLAKWEAEGKVAKHANGSCTMGTGYQKKYATDPLEFALPNWLTRAMESSAYRRELPISSRASDDDIYGVFEVFYARSSSGWLCRSQKRGDAGSLVWGESFAQAVPFSSEQAAMTELKSRVSNGCVLKTSGAFTSVSRVGKPQGDELSDGVAAACEARDIEASLAQSVSERLESYKASLDAQRGGPAEPAKKAARL